MARSKRHINEASTNMTLSQLKAIQENQYRSTCCQYDYDQTSIDQAIARILTNNIERTFNDNADQIRAFIDERIKDIDCPKMRKIWTEYILDELEAKGIY